MSDEAQPNLIYVTSRGHSGSTLTEMLLAGHSQIVALGELKQLGTDRQEDCRCGAGPITQCEFWRSVDSELQREFDLALADLSLDDEDEKVFALHNEALFRSVGAITGARFLIDSSKTMRRLRRLEASGRFRIQVLHLIRSPYGVVYSNVKRGRDWLEHARTYTINMMKTREWLEGREVTTLRYERLVADPPGELRRILGAFGLEFERAQLEWAKQELHTFAGNPMRVTRDSTIRPDTQWRRGLGPARILGVTWWTLPTRFRSDALYRDHLPYWKGEGTEAWREFRTKLLKARRHERRLRIQQSRVIGPVYQAARKLYRLLAGGAG